MIKEHSTLIAKRSGVMPKVVSAAARDSSRAKARIEGCAPVFSDWRDAVAQPGVDAIVELIGGIDESLVCARHCISKKIPFVTANKALLATHGDELFDAAAISGSGIYFEAAVAGCIPAIRTLRDSLAGDRVLSILGIVNGTCNYILTRMSAEGIGFDEALAAATEAGYAEADPTLDIDGLDAAHKAVIMSWLAFGTPLSMSGIDVAGIRDADPSDEALAAEFGYVVKLIAMAREAGEDSALVRVSPALVDCNHSLAKVDGSLNSVLVEASAAGELMLVGAGAGARPTASAVLSDIVEAAKQHRTGCAPAQPRINGTKVIPTGDTLSQTYLRIRVIDVAGVIAKVSSILSDTGISIEGMHQGESLEGNPIDIAMLLHECRWQVALDAAKELSGLEETIGDPALMPIAVPHNR